MLASVSFSLKFLPLFFLGPRTNWNLYIARHEPSFFLLSLLIQEIYDVRSCNWQYCLNMTKWFAVRVGAERAVTDYDPAGERCCEDVCLSWNETLQWFILSEGCSIDRLTMIKTSTKVSDCHEAGAHIFRTSKGFFRLQANQAQVPQYSVWLWLSCR